MSDLETGYSITGPDGRKLVFVNPVDEKIRENQANLDMQRRLYGNPGWPTEEEE